MGKGNNRVKRVGTGGNTPERARRTALSLFEKLTSERKERYLKYSPDPNNEKEWIDWFNKSETPIQRPSKKKRSKRKKKNPVSKHILTYEISPETFGNGRQIYYKYIQSDRWKEVRKKMFDRYGRKCQSCDNRGNLHIHHKTYRNLCNERWSDLEILCARCHMAVHEAMDTLGQKIK